jgi:deazaflavin-dependent oxidoreductase (nitroreductase family)
VPDWKTLNADVIAEFRNNEGRVGRFGDMSILILHTIGAGSGIVREIPLIPVFDGDDMLIFATAAGSATHPDWYFNLRAHPRITVEYGSETFQADVVQWPVRDGARFVAARAESIPQLADYVKSAAPRVIPVFLITPV